jgi:hypothetical protein
MSPRPTPVLLARLARRYQDRRRRGYNDAALESPRAGYVMTGAGAGAFLGALTWAMCALVIGVPPWLYLAAFIGAVFGVASLAMGLHEIQRAHDHRDSMRAYGAEITASFEQLLSDRRPRP